MNLPPLFALRLWLTALGLCLASCAWAQAALPEKPNLVVLFIDDLGYGDVGPFGNKQFKTPHLDRMAAEGRRFTSFYATPVCSMSRASLLTGCYNTRVSVPGVLFPYSRVGLHPQEITLAEICKSRGYATTCIGKWHLGHLDPFLPTEQGFDSYYGIPYSNDMTIDPEHARFAKDCLFREGMTEAKARQEAIRHTVPLMRGTEIIEYPADQSTLTKRYTEEAVQFIQDHRTEPFFLYLPHTMVHVPLAASEQFRGKSSGGLLGDAVEEIDWSVGQILQALADSKLDDRTLVIFTSDNGAASGSSLPWRGKKASVFEGGVREPCIMRWPGQISPGTTCQQIAGNIDLWPTFARLTGYEVPSDRVTDGRDISTLLFQNDAPPVRDTHLYITRGGQLGAIRQGDWKLLLPPAFAGNAQPAKANPAGKKPAGQTNQGDKPAQQPAAAGQKSEPMAPRFELYNLATDPVEANNVAAANPEIVARLREEAEGRNKEIQAHRRPAGGEKDAAQ